MEHTKARNQCRFERSHVFFLCFPFFSLFRSKQSSGFVMTLSGTKRLAPSARRYREQLDGLGIDGERFISVLIGQRRQTDTLIRYIQIGPTEKMISLHFMKTTEGKILRPQTLWSLEALVTILSFLTLRVNGRRFMT